MSDYIKRDSLISKFMPIYKSASLRNRNVFSVARRCMEIAENLPAVPVREVVRGRWVLQGKFCGLNRHECSVCKRSEFRMSNFCPNCGADMRAEEGETT